MASTTQLNNTITMQVQLHKCTSTNVDVTGILKLFSLSFQKLDFTINVFDYLQEIKNNTFESISPPWMILIHKHRKIGFGV